MVRNDVSQMLGSFSYDAYGTRTCTMPSGSCSAHTPFGYTGQYQDEESGLLYLRARYYDPATQQFISRDPQESKTGQPYVYAWGNPVNFVDPSGDEGERVGWQQPLPGFGRFFGIGIRRVPIASTLVRTRPAMTISGIRARFGAATTNDYKATFFKSNPELRGRVTVHHAVEQQVLTRYPGVVTESQIHSEENLRGIPNELNSSMHLGKIRTMWNHFYQANPTVTQEQLLDYATKIDNMFGHLFKPKVR